MKKRIALFSCSLFFVFWGYLAYADGVLWAAYLLWFLAGTCFIACFVRLWTVLSIDVVAAGAYWYWESGWMLSAKGLLFNWKSIWAPTGIAFLVCIIFWFCYRKKNGKRPVEAASSGGGFMLRP